MRLVVTGGAGFIGSNFVRRWLAKRPSDHLTVIDSLSYAGNLENIDGLAERHAGLRFLEADVADAHAVAPAFADPVDVLVHFAAESHVDRSIDDASPFLRTNVLGTHVMLEAARRAEIPRYVQVSTDEVYGTLGPTGAFSEVTPIAPNSPYSASKAAADLMVRAYVETHGLPAIVTRCSNNYGPYQFPEKLIPCFVTSALEDRRLTVYGDGLQVRDWLHVDDHCDALVAVIERGRDGRVYNIGGECERTNLELTHAILAALGKPATLVEHVADRLGHDRRYAMDITRIREELGWAPRVRLEEGLAATVRWYRENEGWWRRIQDGSYREPRPAPPPPGPGS